MTHAISVALEAAFGIDQLCATPEPERHVLGWRVTSARMIFSASACQPFSFLAQSSTFVPFSRLTFGVTRGAALFALARFFFAPVFFFAGAALFFFAAGAFAVLLFLAGFALLFLVAILRE